MKKFFLGVFAFLFAFSFVIIFIAVPAAMASRLPNHVRLTDDEFASMQPIHIPRSQFVKQNTNKITTVGEDDKRFVELKLFGVIPIKKVKVDIMPFDKVIPGGNLIGFKAQVEGVLVTSNSEDGKLKKGDIIKRAGDTQVHSIACLNHVLDKEYDGRLAIEGIRKNQTFKTELEITKGESLGVFLKDETSGIGTVTYINPENNNFASLGHRMNDFETATHVDLRGGTIHDVNILGYDKSNTKKVGGYKSVLNPTKKGDILTSNNFGVFGCLSEIAEGKPYKVTSRYNVKPGRAKVRTTSTSGEVRDYDIEIVKTRFQRKPSTKSMIVRITDKELLANQGGIIHGMSGSPIIQNGRVVGALTHVMLGDFSKGYAIYIDFVMP